METIPGGLSSNILIKQVLRAKEDDKLTYQTKKYSDYIRHFVNKSLDIIRVEGLRCQNNNHGYCKKLWLAKKWQKALVWTPLIYVLI
jgi:hypothetical protein